MDRILIAGDRVRFRVDSLNTLVHGAGGTVEAVVEERGDTIAEVRTDKGRLLKFNAAQARVLLVLEEADPWRFGGPNFDHGSTPDGV